MARSALTQEMKEQLLQFAAENWRAEGERINKLNERTAQLRALRLADADQTLTVKRVKPLKPHVRRAFTVMR